MAQYKKLSDYTVEATPNNGDLVPLIVDNGDGTYDNALMTYESIKGAPGTNGTNGQGVIPGGSTNQVLAKTSGTDYATQWKTIDKTAVGLGNVDNTSDTSKPVSTATQAAINLAVANVMSAIYPVGSIYTNATNNTNPATLLGFGTWVSFGAGRVPVGFDSTQTEFDSAEETGGSKTNSIAQTNLPNVQGALSLHGGENGSFFAGASGVFAARADVRSGYKTLGQTGGSQSLYYQVPFDLNPGTFTPLNNLQPYITVYMWKRTA